jgi:membrane protease YdiL (CAAX protease family)
LLFAVAHASLHPWLLVPGYLAVSLLLGYFCERYNGIRIPVALHVYYNIALLFSSLIFTTPHIF